MEATYILNYKYTIYTQIHGYFGGPNNKISDIIPPLYSLTQCFLLYITIIVCTLLVGLVGGNHNIFQPYTNNSLVLDIHYYFAHSLSLCVVICNVNSITLENLFISSIKESLWVIGTVFRKKCNGFGHIYFNTIIAHSTSSFLDPSENYRRPIGEQHA